MSQPQTLDIENASLRDVEPCVSFGIPVKNGIGHIERCVDSILKQTFQNFEIVIADNQSSDGTKDYLRRLELQEPRVRCFWNEKDIGILENHNKVFRLSRGKYFRWIGADDWIEREFTEECVNLLDRNSEIMGVVTHLVLHYENGLTRRTEYEGERLESRDPARRFVRLFWLLSKGQLRYEPFSGVYRRKALEKTPLLEIVPDSDFVFAANLNFVGPLAYVSKHLVHRTRPALAPSNRVDLYKRIHPDRWKEVRHSYWKAAAKIYKTISRSQLPYSKKVICWGAIFRWWLGNIPNEVLRKVKEIVLMLLPGRSRLVKKYLDRPKARD